MANSTYINKCMYDIEPFKHAVEPVKLNSDTWRGVCVDTWHMSGDKDYQQMVGYVISEGGKEIVLTRGDIPVMEISSLEFHNARRQFYCDLIHWAFHGFADKLCHDVTMQDLIEARQVIQPFDPADAVTHETCRMADHYTLGGRVVFIEVTSEKLTNGPFKWTIDFFTKNSGEDLSRHFIINRKGVQPFIKLSTEYERHKDIIAETLGLKGKP